MKKCVIEFNNLLISANTKVKRNDLIRFRGITYFLYMRIIIPRVNIDQITLTHIQWVHGLYHHGQGITLSIKRCNNIFIAASPTNHV